MEEEKVSVRGRKNVVGGMRKRKGGKGLWRRREKNTGIYWRLC